MNGLVIGAWRQHCARVAEVDAALRQARTLGMKNYAVMRHGKMYWLVCSAQANHRGARDVANVVRQFYAKVACGVYFAEWHEQTLCVAWRGEHLVHCGLWPITSPQACQRASLFAQLEAVLSQSCVVLLARDMAKAWQAYCQQQHPRWQVRVEQPGLAELPTPKKAYLQALSQRPGWQQRQRLMLALLLILSSASLVTWWFWPAPVVSEPLGGQQRAGYTPAGSRTGLLTELPTLLRGFEHLAGWRWQSAELRGQQLVVVFTASYGRLEELIAQVPSYWQVQGQGKTVQLLYRDEVSQAFQAAPEQEVFNWSERYQALFPQLVLRSVAGQQDTHFQWQDYQLQLPSTSLPELQRLAATLDAPHLRLLTLKLKPAQRSLAAELVVRVYRHLPPSLQGASR